MNTLTGLQSELEVARQQFEFARYTDSTAKMMREQSYWAERIKKLEAEIAEIENETA